MSFFGQSQTTCDGLDEEIFTCSGMIVIKDGDKSVDQVAAWKISSWSDECL